ncbi:MAG: hypothetical protein IKD55_10340 [Sediminibacterium sp.]|nr:hypothetical protein [Sediminibacterium sp.]MBX9779841.1 hypothetical protein [Chitinophagaceae bacterium]
MKLSTFLFCLVTLIACTNPPIPENKISIQSDQKIFDSLLNKYIRDTLSQQFENPSSFQFISYNNDTINGSKSDKKMFEMLSESNKVIDSQKKVFIADLTMDSIQKMTSISQLDSQLAQNLNDLLELKKHPTRPDSIIQINVTVNFKIKDKKGKETFNNSVLIYYPKFKTFSEIIGE